MLGFEAEETRRGLGLDVEQHTEVLEFDDAAGVEQPLPDEENGGAGLQQQTDEVGHVLFLQVVGLQQRGRILRQDGRLVGVVVFAQSFHIDSFGEVVADEIVVEAPEKGPEVGYVQGAFAVETVAGRLLARLHNALGERLRGAVGLLVENAEEVPSTEELRVGDTVVLVNKECAAATVVVVRAEGVGAQSGAREPLDEVEFLVGVFAGAHHEQAVLVHPAATLGHEPESVVEGDGPVLAVGFEKGL